MKCIMTFGSTHKVLKAEKVLKEHEVVFRLNPAPKFVKRLKPRCSLIITIDESLVYASIPLLKDADAEVVDIFIETGAKTLYNGVEEDEYRDYEIK